jgi:hypothetical protein
MGEASPIGFVLGTKPGTMIVHQPDIPAPVLINLPLPAWATRSEEVDDPDLQKTARKFAERFQWPPSWWLTGRASSSA